MGLKSFHFAELFMASRFFMSLSMLVLFLVVASVGGAQRPSPNPATSNPSAEAQGTTLPKGLGGGARSGGDTPDDTRRHEMQKNQDAQRNKEIQKETDELLQLANELKKSVDAAVAGDTLSVQVIKKTDEIEKLAKKVRSKMKETYNDGPAMGKLPDASIH
jgi:hypothetical protein